MFCIYSSLYYFIWLAFNNNLHKRILSTLYVNSVTCKNMTFHLMSLQLKKKQDHNHDIILQCRRKWNHLSLPTFVVWNLFPVFPWKNKSHLRLEFCYRWKEAHLPFFLCSHQSFHYCDLAKSSLSLSVPTYMLFLVLDKLSLLSCTFFNLSFTASDTCFPK